MAVYNWTLLDTIARAYTRKTVVCTQLPDYEHSDGRAYFEGGVYKIGLHPSLIGRPGWHDRLPYVLWHEMAHIRLGHVAAQERTRPGMTIEEATDRLATDAGDTLAATVKAIIERTESEADAWATDALTDLQRADDLSEPLAEYLVIRT